MDQTITLLRPLHANVAQWGSVFRHAVPKMHVCRELGTSKDGLKSLSPAI